MPAETQRKNIYTHKILRTIVRGRDEFTGCGENVHFPSSLEGDHGAGTRIRSGLRALYSYFPEGQTCS